MAQRIYRGNLSAAEYPLNPELFGSSVIVAAQDQTLSKYVDSPESRDASIGIPQVIFAENVLPTKSGFASTVHKAVSTGHNWKAGQREMRVFDASGRELVVQFCVSRQGTSTTYDVALFVWATSLWVSSTLGTVTLESSDEVDTYLARGLTYAFVQGHSYVFIQGYGCYWFYPDTYAFVKVTLGGLDESTLIGIVNSSGYLISFSKTAVAWSTTLTLLADSVERDTAYEAEEVVRDPSALQYSVQFRCTTAGTTASVAPSYDRTIGNTTTDGTAVFTAEALTVDFVPSLITGAGGGEVEELDGLIVTAVPALTGFFLYATNNVVSAVATNNAQYPFVFRSIANSSGITRQADVTESAAAGTHYALTKGGLQQVATTGAKVLEPGVSEWLKSGKRTRILVTGETPSVVAENYSMTYGRLAFVGGRYLCISRGISLHNYSECLVYDTALQRYGHIRLDHCTVVGGSNIQYMTDPNLQMGHIVLVSSGGLMTSVEIFTSGSGEESLGLIGLGRYKWVREQLISMHGILLSAVELDTEVFLMGRIAGGTKSAVFPVTSVTTDELDEATGFKLAYSCRATANDFLLLVKAPFALNSVELVITSGGHR